MAAMLVYYTGHISSRAGSPMSLGDDDFTQQLMSLKGDMLFFGRIGGGDYTKNILSAYNWVRQNEDGGDSLIIYGYSYGGVDAMRLADELDDAPTSMGISRYVTLLITVDTAAWQYSNSMARRISRIVRVNLNYWQGRGTMSHDSHGAPNKADNPNETYVYNYERETSHAEIREETMPWCVQAIKNVVRAHKNSQKPSLW